MYFLFEIKFPHLSLIVSINFIGFVKIVKSM
jgi:hypothetical protein